MAHDPHTVDQWFDTSIYTAPAAGLWGNTPRNSVRGPGRDNWSLSLFKNFWFNQERGRTCSSARSSSTCGTTLNSSATVPIKRHQQELRGW